MLDDKIAISKFTKSF